MKQLQGKVSIVTGGGSGIGEACATVFAEEGAQVLVADWNEEAGRRVVAAIQQEGGDAVYCNADVSRAQDVERMIADAISRFGRLDVLVNNAAVQVLGRLADTTEAEWDRVHSVNLKGVFLCCKSAIPAMMASLRPHYSSRQTHRRSPPALCWSSTEE